MAWVIKKGMLYVAKPGSRSAYTNDLRYAAKYPTRETAEANRCPENEHVAWLEQELDIYRR